MNLCNNVSPCVIQEGRGTRTGKGSLDIQVHRKSTPHSSLTDRTSGHLVEGSVTERSFSVSVVGC